MGGNGNMVKNGGGNGAAEETVLNQYMTWSKALNPLLKEGGKFKDYLIAIGSDGKNRTNITIGHLEKKEIKDLGGGDQAKIKGEDGLEAKDKTIKKFNIEDTIALLTGGTDDERISTVKKFKYGNKPPLPEDGNKPPLPEDGNKPPLSEDGNKPPLPEDGNKPPLSEDGNKPPLPEPTLYALKIKAETAFTAAAYYDYVHKHIFKVHTYSNVVAIPIGSTDVHVINYNKDGTVETRNLANYKTGDATKISAFVSEKVGDNTLIVFGASAFHTLKKMISFETEFNIDPTLTEYGTTVSELKELITKYSTDTNNFREDKVKDLKTSIDKLFPESMNAIQIKIKVSNSNIKGKSFSVDAFEECLKGLSPTAMTAKSVINGVIGKATAARALTQPEEPVVATGGRRRRTRKVSKNRRKSMKAKNMRRKNKNKSSKGKKSKTSRRR